LCGQTSQGEQGVAIGYLAGQTNQGLQTVAIGSGTANSSQGQYAVAIGWQAACNAQRSYSVAIGWQAGMSNQSTQSIAIGTGAAQLSQGNNAIAIGSSAAATNQGRDCVAIGTGVCQNGQGNNSIAIGANACAGGQPSNSIVFNASQNQLNPVTANAFYVNPIRNASNANVLTYNTGTYEISYTAKSFVIPHPTDTTRWLVHGCLEGPEAGVYYRGKATLPTSSSLPCLRISLPDYVPHFATDFTVSVTPIGPVPRVLSASEVVDGAFTVYGPPGPFHWVVHGSRATLEAEPKRSNVVVEGTGPYRYIHPK
jgi:hypothetical protein